MFDLDQLLRLAVEQRASDVHVKVGARPRLRVDGVLREAPLDVVEPADTEEAVRRLLGHAAIRLDGGAEVDGVHAVQGLSRFRVSAYRQRGWIGLVLRRVVPGVPTLDALGLPPVAAELAAAPSGLVLITGLAGSGRTSTLAAMVDHVNEHRPAHIVTIEQPIEVLHPDKLAVVDQREVGSDTTSFLSALLAAAHQDPDVVVVSDLPDTDSVLAALEIADAGRLVLAATQAIGAADAVTRLIERFSPAQQAPMRALIARTLRGVLCQRLVPRAGGRGRVPALEVLIANGPVAEAVGDPDGGARLDPLIAEGEFWGMQTFDQGLAGLYGRGLVTRADALANATYEPGLSVMLDAADRERAGQPISIEPWPTEPSPEGPVSVG